MTGWLALRRMVYRRDGGICQACLLPVGRRWDAGHLVDRCVGGDNTLSNLVLMCARCNRSEKPITRTLGEAHAWLAERRDRAHGVALPDQWRTFYEGMYGRT
jgi:5-methylcytosine-specific restriction endonuclease McrA